MTRGRSFLKALERWRAIRRSRLCPGPAKPRSEAKHFPVHTPPVELVEGLVKLNEDPPEGPSISPR